LLALSTSCEFIHFQGRTGLTNKELFIRRCSVDLGPPLIDMVVCVFSVGRRPATLETYQSAPSRPTRGGFSLLYRIYVEIFGGRKFRENLEAQNPHPPENFGKISSHHTRFVIKWIFSQSAGVRVDRRLKPTYQLTAALTVCLEQIECTSDKIWGNQLETISERTSRHACEKQ
jgi:hypothetical protein